MTVSTLPYPGVKLANDGLQATTASGTGHPSPAEGVIAQALAERPVIQDFCPLATSIEWQLGQRYLQERGTKAFLSDVRPVPYVVNNDGTLSRNAAEVFLANLIQAESAGSLEPEIFALEVGIGVGLFARYFLDAFRDLCFHHGKNYYDRLCYIAADRSEQMLRDVCRHAVFADHPGRYLLRVVDALQPQHYLLKDIAVARQGPQPFRAVFLNYLLDCLPAAVLEVDEHGLRQLCVRTCLARGTSLSEHTELSAEQLAQRAGSADPKDQHDLLEVYGLFASEYDYRPVDIDQIPYGDFAVQFARSKSNRVLASYGAIQCLEHLLGLVQPEGFILMNDYGQTQVTPGDQYEHQRFSHATFMGVNFPLLKAYFADSQKRDWVEPPEENQSIHSRLLGHKLPEVTMVRFRECFSKTALDWVQAPAQHAREFA